MTTQQFAAVVVADGQREAASAAHGEIPLEVHTPALVGRIGGGKRAGIGADAAPGLARFDQASALEDEVTGAVGRLGLMRRTAAQQGKQLFRAPAGMLVLGGTEQLAQAGIGGAWAACRAAGMVGKGGHTALFEAHNPFVASHAADAKLAAERDFAVFLAEPGVDEHFSLLHDVRLSPGHGYLRGGDTVMLDVNEVFRLFCKGGLWVVPRVGTPLSRGGGVKSRVATVLFKTR